MAKVLLVDDDPAMLRFLARALAECGHETCEAANGDEALNLLSAAAFDLVLTDLLMPVMDGFELVLQIRSDPAIAATRVLFFTGAFYRAEVRELARMAGVGTILTKPATGEEVQRAVNQVLQSQNPTERPEVSDFVRQHQRLLVEKISAAERAQATAEQARRDSERRSRALFEHSLDAILLASNDGRCIDANPAACAMLGYTLKELLCLTAPDLVAGSLTCAQWHRFLTTSKFQSECRLLRKDGSLLEVEFGAVAHIEPGIHLAIIRDITARKQSEEALRQSEQKLNLAIAASDLGIWDWDIVGNRFVWSERCKALFGVAPEVQNDMEAFVGAVHRDDRELVKAAILRAHAEKTAYSIEYRIVWPDGSVRWIAARGRATFDANGKPVRSIGTAHDITERKRIETQSLRAQRLESLGTLAGGIAHDLNNVFAPIVLAIGLLKSRFPDSESHNVLEMIQKSADRGVEMVRQVLAFARGIDGERFLITPSLLLEDVQRIIADTFPKNIFVTTLIASDLWNILGNTTQLHQVLINLCINARDAMPHGGQLVLSAENITLHPGNTVSTIQPADGPYLLLQVRDNGCGIPSDILENIFDPFFTTKEFGKGTGLGLSTSLGIVKSHGGFIQAESEPGKGTTFKIYLPAALTPKAAVEEAPVKVNGGGFSPAAGQLILLIDDEAPIRNITSKILRNSGYSVLTAANGAEALELYLRHQSSVALVITDMMMPVMDGSTTIHRLRQINPELKIISTSGLPASEHDVEEKYFLQKPYSKETLLRTVSNALRPFSDSFSHSSNRG